MKPVCLSLLVFGGFIMVQAGLIIASLEPEESLDAFTIGVIGWGAVPFLMDAAIVLLVRKRAVARVFAAFTCLLGLVDLRERYMILFQPGSSTDSIAVMFLPIYHISAVMILLFVGLISAWLFRIPIRKGKRDELLFKKGNSPTPHPK